MADAPGDTPPPLPRLRGFAAMSKEKLRELSSRGGQAAHAGGKAASFTPETAKEAGRLGGLALAEDREWMREIGARGGVAAKGKPRRAPKPRSPTT